MTAAILLSDSSSSSPCHHILNVAYLAACVRDKSAYQRFAFSDIKPQWLPIFEPDAAALSGVGDAILKINQAVPDYLGAKGIRQLTGIEGENNG